MNKRQGAWYDPGGNESLVLDDDFDDDSGDASSSPTAPLAPDTEFSMDHAWLHGIDNEDTLAEGVVSPPAGKLTPDAQTPPPPANKPALGAQRLPSPPGKLLPGTQTLPPPPSGKSTPSPQHLPPPPGKLLPGAQVSSPTDRLTPDALKAYEREKSLHALTTEEGEEPRTGGSALPENLSDDDSGKPPNPNRKEDVLLGVISGGGSIPGMIGGAIGGAVGGPAGAILGSTAGQVVGQVGSELLNTVVTPPSAADLSSYTPEGGNLRSAPTGTYDLDHAMALMGRIAGATSRMAEVGVKTTPNKPSHL
jgi:hypothetical protein